LLFPPSGHNYATEKVERKTGKREREKKKMSLPVHGRCEKCVGKLVNLRMCAAEGCDIWMCSHGRIPKQAMLKIAPDCPVDCEFCIEPVTTWVCSKKCEKKKVDEYRLERMFYLMIKK